MKPFVSAELFFLESARPQRWFKWGSILLIAAAGVWALSRNPGPDRLVIDVGTVTRRASFQSSVSASGEIVATRSADIGSSIMGRIVSLPVSEGDTVRGGQLLARIDPVQAESDAAGAVAEVRALEAEQAASAEQVRGATADHDTAKARARDADQQFARQRDLHQAGLISAAEFETARAQAEAASAQEASAEAAIDRARRALEAATGRVARARAQVRRATDLVAKTGVTEIHVSARRLSTSGASPSPPGMVGITAGAAPDWPVNGWPTPDPDHLRRIREAVERKG